MNYLRNLLHFHLICFGSISLQTTRTTLIICSILQFHWFPCDIQQELDGWSSETARIADWKIVAKLLPTALLGFLVVLFVDKLVPAQGFRQLMGWTLALAMAVMIWSEIFGKESRWMHNGGILPSSVCSAISPRWLPMLPDRSCQSICSLCARKRWNASALTPGSSSLSICWKFLSKSLPGTTSTGARFRWTS